jgi:hypothetical protein
MVWADATLRRDAREAANTEVFIVSMFMELLYLPQNRFLYPVMNDAAELKGAGAGCRNNVGLHKHAVRYEVQDHRASAK